MYRFVGVIAGILLIAIGGFIYVRNDNLVKNCTEEVVATIVDIEEEISTDDDGVEYIYYPVIEYKALGNIVKVKMNSGSSTQVYNVDDKITILYNPNNTKEFVVKGDKSLNIFSVAFMALGVLVTGLGVAFAVKNKV